MTDISIAIVSYNDEANVRNAVCSIMEHTAALVSKKIYIIDNSTRENSLQDLEKKYQQLEYLATGENLGFGRGHIMSWIGWIPGFMRLLTQIFCWWRTAFPF